MPRAPGKHLCVEDGGSPLRKIRPVGAVIIVILYWLVEAPGVAWREHLETALHATVTAVSVQITFELAYAARRSAALAGRWASQVVRRVYRWVTDRVDVQFGGFKFQLGAR